MKCGSSILITISFFTFVITLEQPYDNAYPQLDDLFPELPNVERRAQNLPPDLGINMDRINVKKLRAKLEKMANDLLKKDNNTLNYDDKYKLPFDENFKFNDKFDDKFKHDEKFKFDDKFKFDEKLPFDENFKFNDKFKFDDKFLLNEKLKFDDKVKYNDTRKQAVPDIWYHHHRAVRMALHAKLMDLSLQVIYMARYKVKQMDRGSQLYSKTDTGYRIAYLYRRMRKLWRLMLECYTYMVQLYKKKDNKYYLAMHMRVIKLHSDFVYVWWILVGIHGKHKMLRRTTTPMRFNW